MGTEGDGTSLPPDGPGAKITVKGAAPHRVRSKGHIPLSAPKSKKAATRQSFKEEYHLNARYLLYSAAVHFPPEEIAELFGNLDVHQLRVLGSTSNQPLKKNKAECLEHIYKRMNEECTRIAFCLLCDTYLFSDGAQREFFGEKKFQRTLEDAVVSAPKRFVQRNLVPLLAQAGFVEGHEASVRKEHGEYRIRITPKGINRHLKSLLEVKKRMQPYDKQIQDD